MKTHKNKLGFNKKSIAELNNKQLKKVKGGWDTHFNSVLGTRTLGCTLCINSSNGPGNEHLNDIVL